MACIRVHEERTGAEGQELASAEAPSLPAHLRAKILPSFPDLQNHHLLPGRQLTCEIKRLVLLHNFHKPCPQSQ